PGADRRRRRAGRSRPAAARAAARAAGRAAEFPEAAPAGPGRAGGAGRLSRGGLVRVATCWPAGAGTGAELMTIYAAERLVTPHEVLAPGWFRVDGDRITEVGAGSPAETAERLDGWVLPGFVDMHVHGGGGASFTTGDPEQARRAAAFHRRHGTTTMLASL